MAYADALQALLQAGADTDVPLASEPVDEARAAQLATVFGEELSGEIAEHGYPSGTAIPWIVEELYLYGLDELADRQQGYRIDAGLGRAVADWDDDRWVIADWTANPISISKDGTIHYARHGEGAWTHIPIAPDLAAFFSMLAAWLRYFTAERGGNLFDDDFEIPQATRDEIDRRVLGAIDEPRKGAALRFLLGEL